MTDTLGSYTFLPWLRQGVARAITSADGDTSVKLRATANVALTITGHGLDGSALTGDVKRDVELYSPGEVVGIESRAIVRTDPRPWITNFEPNYLAAIEFYEEDFPWRYTPTAPDSTRRQLKPWITLVVLKDTGDPATSEFQDARAVPGRPLPAITVKDYAGFPPAADLWAWAHVHVNRHLGANADELVAADVPAAVGRLAAALAGNADLGYSRIVCPRRLDANTAYHAFLVPTFERGRLAGLGASPDAAPFASASAWIDYTDRPESFNMPYYHRWYFRTGGEGDFESLVKLLKWKTVDPRVGYRDMDVMAPGSNIPAIADAALKGVLSLGGALRPPLSVLKPDELAKFKVYDEWAKATYPHIFQRRLAGFINLADSITAKPSVQARTDAGLPPSDPDDVDPLITSPIYGEWQALQHRLLTDAAGLPLPHNDNWIHELNLDPRYRVAAGFGGDVVRKYQEDYMEAAWLQVGDVLAHNHKVGVAKSWLLISNAIHAKTIATIAHSPSRLLAFTAPVQVRVLSGGITVRHARQQSLAPAVLTSPTMRRIIRPGGRIARKLELTTGPHAGGLIEAVNTGAITAAPPKQAPPGITTVEQVASSSGTPSWPPEWLHRLTRQVPWLGLLLAILAVVIAVLAIIGGGLLLVLLVVAAVLAAAAVIFELARRRPSVDEALGDDLEKPGSIDHLAADPNFVFGDAGNDGHSLRPFGFDNEAGKRFKAALKDWGGFAVVAEAAGAVTVKLPLELVVISTGIVESLRPINTIPKRFLSAVVLAPHIREQSTEDFGEVKYYPRIDMPMYKPLKELGDDHFVPNLELIERETVVALRTNQEFIESYMVGVNHEFSRELLWREYPTDQRGTTFRQFWDVTGHFDPDATDLEALREKLYDIPPIHRWRKDSTLGQHDNREPDPNIERDEIVLVIRGELLKKYPTTIIYAHAAQWAVSNGHIDPSKERTLVDLTAAEFAKPPRNKVLTPLYEARVDPDIYFFGFDLTEDEARGDSGDSPNDRPGWFFVLKERPGEPRFGLDSARPPAEPIVTVNDLAWTDVGTVPGAHLSPAALASISLTAPSSARDDLEKQPQYDDDKKVVGAAISASRWAYLLYQAPVMVAVHANELLKPAE